MGADIGQAQDYTAIAAVEAKGIGSGDILALRHLERVPLGVDYPAIVDRICAIEDAVPTPRALVVDATGVGRPVVDLLVKSGRSPLGVVITPGRTVTRRCAFCYVPKSALLQPLVSALEYGRLRIARGLPAGEAFRRELQAFRVGITAGGITTYGAVAGEHDDMVLAVALALWRLAAAA